MKNKGLSVIIETEEEFNKIKNFIGEENLYLEWNPRMSEIETAIVIFYHYKDEAYSIGSIGCAITQQNNGLRTVFFDDFFK